MHKIDSAGATNTGEFKETPAPATRVSADWLNAIQAELVRVVTDPQGGAVALNKGDTTQLLTAILAMIGRGVANMVTVQIEAGDQKTITFAGGLLILKQGYWRETFNSEVTRTVNFQTPFPGGCWSVLTQGVLAAPSIYKDLWTQVIDPSRSANGFTVQLQSDDDNDHGLAGFDWWAIGN